MTEEKMEKGNSVLMGHVHNHTTACSFPELLHVPCGILTPFLPVTAAFGMPLFPTFLHKSKHLRDPL